MILISNQQCVHSSRCTVVIIVKYIYAEQMAAGNERGIMTVQLDEHCQYFCIANKYVEHFIVNVKHRRAHFVTFPEPHGSVG